jgi:flagellar hook-length control protein FliK
VKAAAPQAPQITQAAKSGKSAARAKTASPTSSSATAGFDRILARAVARGRESPGANAGAAVRQPAPVAVVPEQAAETARKGGANRTTARTPARGRADDGTAAERTGAEALRTVPPVGNAAAAAVVQAVSAPAAGAVTATAAPAKQAEPKIQVIDLRKKAGTSGMPEAARNAQKSPMEKTDAPAVKPFAERLATVEPKPAPAAPARATPLERLREMTGSDLVKTAGLVVRDGGGEIRLTLKPESLGSVRIRLSLEDGKVEGRIVVDTPEARQAFEAGIEGLTRALQADGFQTGALQVSVSGGNANDSRQAAGLLGDTIAAARLRAADGLPSEAAIVSGWTGDGLVNVYA